MSRASLDRTPQKDESGAKKQSQDISITLLGGFQVRIGDWRALDASCAAEGNSSLSQRGKAACAA
jgi:hypothetical protein